MKKLFIVLLVCLIPLSLNSQTFPGARGGTFPNQVEWFSGGHSAGTVYMDGYDIYIDADDSRWENGTDDTTYLYLNSLLKFTFNLSGLTIVNGLWVGSGNSTDFPDAQAVISQADTGQSDANKIGIVGEAASVAGGDQAYGIYGFGLTASNRAAVGVKGVAVANATGDTSNAYGLVGSSTSTHASGPNIALNVEASGGSANYAIQIAAGDIDSTTPAIDWDLKDNDASAISIDTTGLAALLELKTTNGEETVNTTGKITTTATALDAATGDESAMSITYTTNKLTSGNDYGIRAIQTDTSSPGSSYLISLETSTDVKFSIDNTGVVYLDNSDKIYNPGAGSLAMSVETDISSGDAYTFGHGSGIEMTASSGDQRYVYITPLVKQTGTAGYSGLTVDSTETSTGSGTKRLASFQVSSVEKFGIANTGAIYGADSDTIHNSAAGTWTIWGTGSASAEDLSFAFGNTGDQVDVSSSTSVAQIDFGTINLATDGADLSDGNITNVGDIQLDSLTGDSTAGVSIGGTGATSEERITFVFGATSNNIDVTTSTSATGINFTALDINTTAGISAENIYSSDDGTITDSLSCGDFSITEAAGKLDFTGGTSGEIETSTGNLIVDIAGDSLVTEDNKDNFIIDIPVSGADATAHYMQLSIDQLSVLNATATGNGAGTIGAITTNLGVTDGADVIHIGDANALVDITDAHWSITEAGAITGTSLSISGDIDMNQNDLLDAASVVVATAKGGLGTLKTASQTLTFTDDASQATSGLIPDGVTLHAIMGRVVTANTGACTSIDIGDGTDVDLFGDNVAVADTTTFTPAQATANWTNPILSASEVTITGVGGNCDALVVNVVAIYTEYTAPNID